MKSTKQIAITITIVTIAFTYLWNYLFADSELLSTAGSSLTPVIIGLLSASMVVTAIKRLDGKGRYPWFFILIGLIIHVFGNLYWFVSAVTNGLYQPKDSMNVIWLTAYLFFLCALLFHIHLIKKTINGDSYLFNFVIFLITLITILVHYFVIPYWETEDHLFQLFLYGLLFPFVDCSMLLASTFLYYLYRGKQGKTFISLFTAAFYLQILGDLLVSNMKTNQQYHQLLIEPMWVGALLLIGFAALFAPKLAQVNEEVAAVSDRRESFFPYLSTFILLILEQINQSHINVLSIGTGLIYSFIILRLLLFIRKNWKLVHEYRDLAYSDPLTGLKNRASFQKDLELDLAKTINQTKTFSLLLIDLDRFKMINDTLGHLAGDQLLKLVAQKLQHTLKDTPAQIYRLGGDEFVVTVEDASKQACVKIASQIIEELGETFLIAAQDISITPSIGIASYPFNGQDAETLFRAADAAMYVAKANGKNTFQFYNSTIHKTLNRKMMIETELRKAIVRDELSLFYQPKIHLKTGRMYGMEALLRWHNETLGWVSPAEFIPIAEDTGLIVEVGEWVLREGCRQLKKWHRAGHETLCLSVNVSVQQLKRSNLVQTVKKVIEETEIQPIYLELEITESVMQNINESKRILAHLRVLGVKISLDDFGTGYSSLNVIKELPISTLKMDKAFIDNIKEKTDRSMIKAIINMASALQLEMVAEGIESEEQLQLLLDYQCDYGQGYYFSKPLPAVEFEKRYLNDEQK